MVNGGEGTVGSSNFSASVSQTLESLRRGDFMDEMSVDVEKSVSSTRVHDVIVKDLVVEGSRSRSGDGHVD